MSASEESVLMKHAGKRVAVSEIYGPVLCGEGPVAGRATVFVRLFGCDSRCKQCDSLYAVDPRRADAEFEYLEPEQIVERINAVDKSLPITFSGGNPAIWDLSPVLDLLPKGRPVWLETQGTYWREWIKRCDVVVVSPKGPFMADARHGLTSPQHLNVFYTRVRDVSFKVVVGSSDDLDYAEKIASYYPSAPIFLSLGCVDPLGSPPDSQVLLGMYASLQELLIAKRELWPQLVERAHFLPQLHVLVYGHARGV